MTSTVSWPQLVTVAITTFVCTLSGLYIHHRLSTASASARSQHEKPMKHHQHSKKTSKSNSKATQFWDNYHCDQSSTTEWLADWSELKTFVLAQLTKILNQNKDKHEMSKSEVRILIVGNGLSTIPLHLYQAGYTNITVSDISESAITAMRHKHSAQYPELNWLTVDCTNMQDTFDDASFDLVFDKGVSDTLQYRRPSKQSNQLLQAMFAEISRVLVNRHGKYLLITPRRKVPLLKLVTFNWSVRRVPIRKFDPAKRAHSSAEQQAFLYLHVCSKMNEHHHVKVMQNQQVDRRREFEKAADGLSALQRLNLSFEPLVEITDIERDIFAPYKRYEERTGGDGETRGILKEIDSYFVIHGIIQHKRKFGKKLMFYQVTLLQDESDKKQTLQCIAERAFVATLSNPNFRKEFATNYMTKCGDEVKIYGRLGLSNKGTLSLLVYYVSLIQYHCNWKYE